MRLDLCEAKSLFAVTLSAATHSSLSLSCVSYVQSAGFEKRNPIERRFTLAKRWGSLHPHGDELFRRTFFEKVWTDVVGSDGNLYSIEYTFTLPKRRPLRCL